MSSRLRSSTLLAVLQLGVVLEPEEAQGRARIDHEIRHLQPLRRDRQGRDRDVGVARGQDRDLRLVADRHHLELDAQAVGIVLRQHPGWAGVGRAAAGRVLRQPRELADRRGAQRAAGLDRVDLGAGSRRRHGRSVGCFARTCECHTEPERSGVKEATSDYRLHGSPPSFLLSSVNLQQLAVVARGCIHSRNGS